MTRIKKGRKLQQKHNPILSNVEKHYHVQPRFLVALWGIETNYGEYTGGFSVIRSLVTLAYDERRSEFFRKELLLALKIINEKHISAEDMMGSWAGAMGQNQFMPSSFNTYAVDFNNDGKKDIWNDLEDIFASSSNYLSSQGWRSDITWGREVRIPDDFDENLATVSAKKLEINKKLSEWQSLGVRKVNGENLPTRDIYAYLVLPNGIDGRAYLAYENFKTYLRDDEVQIDYKYLWDLICKPNEKLFQKGSNLIILEIPEDDVTDNVNIICPTNHYSNEMFDTNKETIILLKKQNYYEPIYLFEDKGSEFSVMRRFNTQIASHIPDVIKTLHLIKYSMKNKCGPKNSDTDIRVYK